MIYDISVKATKTWHGRVTMLHIKPSYIASAICKVVITKITKLAKFTKALP